MDEFPNMNLGSDCKNWPRLEFTGLTQQKQAKFGPVFLGSLQFFTISSKFDKFFSFLVCTCFFNLYLQLSNHILVVNKPISSEHHADLGCPWFV